MKTIYRSWIIFSLITLIFSVTFAVYVRSASAQTTNPPSETDQAIRAAVASAVEKSVQGQGPSILGFVVNKVEVDRIIYAKDGRTAIVWLAMRDQFSGDIIGREPGIAVARNAAGILATPSSWQISFETPNTMVNQLSALPTELITDEMRQRYTTNNTLLPALSATTTFTGYKLPYSNALRIKLTGSVGHFLDYNSCAEISCRYAYDFWNPDPGNRMFPLLASKGGILVAARESCADHDNNCTNYLVLQDNSTNPTTYQLYYHLANDSIPNSLTLGTFVQQGQYIGNVDDTGYSTDSHLHFMVFQTPTSANYFWGYSVRILFSDVTSNGGEPRTCAETINYTGYGTECSPGADGKKLTSDDDYFISGNIGTQSPTGTLDVPFAWTTLSEPTLTVSGSAKDSLGITRVDVLVNYSGSWKTIANADYANGVYAKSVDLCSAGVPDGPVSLAVRIWNLAGNWAGPLTGLRQIFKNAPCGTSPAPAPACTPSANEVALYTEAGLTGFCQKFGPGQYSASQLGPVGDNGASSIQIGANMRAVLYDQALDLTAGLPTGRMETFAVDDGNLGDNRLGAKRASALWVMNASDVANPSTFEPLLTFPGTQIDSNHNSATLPNPPNPKSSDSLVLTWTGGRGAVLFTASLKKNNVVVKSMSAANTQSWSVGSLPAGTYLWTVTACGGITTCGTTTNSSTLTFTVDAAALSTSGQIDAPTATLDIESGTGSWSATGLWRWGDANRLQPDLTTQSTKAWIFNKAASSSYSDSSIRAGDLTSPPIRISASGTYYLHFRFFSAIEGAEYSGQTFAAQHWDQRRVQVSINNGDFSDLSSLPSVAPLSEDTQNTAAFWPDSPYISLGALTSGQIVRVRFHFDTIDEISNSLFGWAIDDVRIDTNGPETACATDKANESPASATTLTLDNPPFEGRICPKGDVDYYAFAAPGGTAVRIKINAKTSSALNPLDSFIQLIDTNGKDIIASNDDEDSTNPAPSFRDSLIETILAKTGTYYVRVRSWDYPGAGGTNYPYTISVTRNTAAQPIPTVAITKPKSAKLIPIVPFVIEANATDPNGSGIQRVDVFFHTSDWVNGSWSKVGSDTNGSDGWWTIFNPTMDVTGGAFYVMATNNAGATAGAVLNDLLPDNKAPSSALQSLPASTNSTAVRLTWTAVDIQNDISHFEIQYKLNGAATWSDWSTQPASSARAAWFVGQPGSYAFRIRAVDQAQNAEEYPPAAEASTTLTAACSNDSFEPGNNTRASAVPLAKGEFRRMTLCQNDTDWISFSALKGQRIILLFPSYSGGAGVRIRLYDPSGATVLVDNSAPGTGTGLYRTWKAPANGTYSIEITPLNAAIYGSDVQYGAFAGTGGIQYMPIVGR